MCIHRHGRRETEEYPGCSTLHLKGLQDERSILRKLILLFSPGLEWVLKLGGFFSAVGGMDSPIMDPEFHGLRISC